MLMQLVCVDRRYEKMNCFNIRQLQGILKRRFFTDLVNSSDHREILSSSMIGLRFKNNNNINLNHDTLSFFKQGTTNSDRVRSSQFSNLYSSSLESQTLGLGRSYGVFSPLTFGDFTVLKLASSLSYALP